MKNVRVTAFLLATVFVANTVSAETWAERLGYPTGRKVLILSADHMGGAYEFNRPGQKLLIDGSVQSASVLVPCVWFDEFADWARQNPGHDLGVCLCLNSANRLYRVRPLSDRCEVPSLIDADGFFWDSPLQVAIQADAQEVELELRRQIDRARASGIQPTHLSTHLGSLLAQPELTEIYLRLAREYWLPAVIPELTPERIKAVRDGGFPLSDEIVELIAQYPLPKLDDLRFVPDAESYEQKREEFLKLVRELPPGLTQILVHPADHTKALERVSPRWKNRLWEAELLQDQQVHKMVDEEQVILTNWKEIMQRFSEGASPASKATAVAK